MTQAKRAKLTAEGLPAWVSDAQWRSPPSIPLWREEKVFDAVEADYLYVFSHPRALGNVKSRMESILALENPAGPFLERPEIGAQLRAALRGQ